MNQRESTKQFDEFETDLKLDSKSLIKSVLVAISVALIIFYSVIYPVEFGKDPLGTGKLFGLSHLTDVSPTSEAVLDKSDVPAQRSLYSFQRNSEEIIIPANGGLEYKFKLEQYGNLVYQWTSSSPLYFDFHGEPKDNTTGYFESYTIATSDKMEGSMTMPFDGVHGWYWKNTGAEDVIVTLKTEGNYDVVGLLH